MAKYSIDYEEEKTGGEILRGVLDKIAEELEEYTYGNQSYGEALYKIGEKLSLAGGALHSECRYADKSEDSDKYVDEFGGDGKRIFDEIAKDYIK